MPELSRTVRSLKPSVFATLNEKMKALAQPPIYLHLGDTYALPVTEACWTGMDLSSAGLYRYSHPFGLPALLEALADKLGRRNGLAVTPDWLQVTCGATQALHCGLQTLLEPGQEVLLLAPYWPLFGGMCRCQGVVPIEVDCTPRLRRGEISLTDVLEAARTPGTRALYFSNPNNPDGYVYSRFELEQLADFAQRHDLWVFSDECYEDYVYDGDRQRSIAALPGMEKRTVTVFSFSKSFAMAGHRLGYALAHPEIMGLLRRAANHTVYNVSPTVQKAGLAMLARADSFCAEWLPRYQAARALMVEALGCFRPAGGAYCFPDFGSAQAAWDFLERALQAGVAVAPGAAFGTDYAGYLRVCFTCVEPDQLERACRILKQLR